MTETIFKISTFILSIACIILTMTTWFPSPAIVVIPLFVMTAFSAIAWIVLQAHRLDEQDNQKESKKKSEDHPVLYDDDIFDTSSSDSFDGGGFDGGGAV